MTLFNDTNYTNDTFKGRAPNMLQTGKILATYQNRKFALPPQKNKKTKTKTKQNKKKQKKKKTVKRNKKNMNLIFFSNFMLTFPSAEKS